MEKLLPMQVLRLLLELEKARMFPFTLHLVM